MAVAAGVGADLRGGLSAGGLVGAGGGVASYGGDWWGQGGGAGGAGALVTAADELPSYGHDWWAQRGVPGAVVRAASVEDMASTLRYAARHGVAVVPRAAGT